METKSWFKENYGWVLSGVTILLIVAIFVV